MVTHMNQKWRIILGICLVTSLCVPMVSAAIQAPTTQYSFNRPSFEQLNTGESLQYSNQHILKIQNSFNEQTSTILGNSQISDFSGKTSDLLKSTIASPSSGITQTALADPGQYITEEEAVAIALAQYPDIELTEPIRATFNLINAPGYPLATNPCWEVEIIGYDRNTRVPLWFNGEPTDKFLNSCSGGIVIIDAVTGEILYRLIPASSSVEFFKRGE